MTIADIILIILIVAAVIGAGISCYRNRGRCCSYGKCENCSGCHKYK